MILRVTLRAERREYTGVLSVLRRIVRAQPHPGFLLRFLSCCGRCRSLWFRGGLFLGLGIALSLLTNLPSHSASNLSVRVNRWIEVQQVSGTVTYLHDANSKPARLGDRLQSVGDKILTATDSAATLAVDTQIGTIEVAENTSVLVKALERTPSNGHVTRLQVDWGRVQLRVRRFNNPDSQLEIQTPAGVSGVRGTEFGVNVAPTGKMGVATLKGAVVTTAQGTEIAVPAGFQNVTLPGEPPSQPVPFTNQPRLDYRVTRITRYYRQQILLEGQVDPTSTLLINGNLQDLDRYGRFRLLFPAPTRQRLIMTVVTPLGQEQSYDVELI